MKSILLAVWLAAAATAAVISNDVPVDVPDVVKVIDFADGDEVADVGINELPEFFVTDVDELTKVSDEAEEPQTVVETRRNLNLGVIAARDVLVLNGEFRATGVWGHFHTRDIRVSTNRRISAVRVNRVGASQNATPSIISGGIGSSFVTIRIRSATGRGYHYRVQVYVR